MRNSDVRPLLLFGYDSIAFGDLDFLGEKPYVIKPYQDVYRGGSHDYLSQFTTPGHMPVTTRMIWPLKRYVLWLLGFQLPCPYISHRRRQVLEHGYFNMECIPT